MSAGRKLPYQYAAEFMKAGFDKDKQKQALKGCPEFWRDQVTSHIKAERDKLKHGISSYAQYFGR